ncbi:MAG: hypothetical protein GY870_13465 [archaeon]|nr:hypothetical protein [archaeon]
MEFLWAFLILIGFFVLTSVLSGFLGLLIPIILSLLGFILGTESIILGIGGLLGSIVNVYVTSRYIRTQGAMSHAPRYSKTASIGFIVVFIATITLKYAFKVELSNFNYWYLLIIAFVAWVMLSTILKKNRKQSLDDLIESVIKYKIVEKYVDDPKWATYLYYDNGKEFWNQTIPGSFLAKDPKNDLTFVHNTKEKALEYAQDFFENAEYIEG